MRILLTHTHENHEPDETLHQVNQSLVAFPIDQDKIYPGVTVEQVRASCGCPLQIAETLHVTSLPPESILLLLREKLDPGHLYI